MSSINETIAEVLRLDGAATPGPWVDIPDAWEVWRDDEDLGGPVCSVPDEGGMLDRSDADLIAYYRTAAPALAREVQRLRLDHADECLGSCCEGYNLGYDDGRRAGQEAMRERVAALCDEAVTAIRREDRWDPEVRGAEAEADRLSRAIRALEVEP